MAENNDIDFDRFLELKMSTLKEASNHVLNDLLDAVKDYENEPQLVEAANVLAAWDRQMDTSSAGSFLFESFMSEAPRDLYVNEWSPNDPLGTPNTLVDPAAAVAALRSAVAREAGAGRALNVLFGEINRLPVGTNGDSVAGNGCSDCFRNAAWTNGNAASGDSFVGLVEFTPDGAKGKVSIGYGNSSPGSRGAEVLGHANDQNELFSRKQLRDAWRTREEIDLHLEEAAEVSY
jgi:acyl-homoserine-lactone acylase